MGISFYTKPPTKNPALVDIDWSSVLSQEETRKRNHKTWLVALGTALTMLSFSVMATGQKKAEPQWIGFVLEMKGKWVLLGANSLIKLGQKLPAGGRVRAKLPNDKSSYITIALLNDKKTGRTCDVPGACSLPFILPEETSNGTIVRRIMNVFEGILIPHTERFVVPLSRGADDINNDVSEAVVELRDGQVDLSSMFRSMPTGEYLLSIESVTFDRLLTTSKSLQFDWDPNDPRTVRISDLKPGLYQVRLLGKRKPVLPLQGDAMILVSSPEHYREALASFQAAQYSTREWRMDKGLDAVRSFLRIYLWSLAHQIDR